VWKYLKAKFPEAIEHQYVNGETEFCIICLEERNRTQAKQDDLKGRIKEEKTHLKTFLTIGKSLCHSNSSVR